MYIFIFYLETHFIYVFIVGKCLDHLARPRSSYFKILSFFQNQLSHSYIIFSFTKENLTKKHQKSFQSDFQVLYILSKKVIISKL